MGRKDRLADFLDLLRVHPDGVESARIARELGVTRQHVYRLRDRAREVYGLWVDDASTDPHVPRGRVKLHSRDTGDIALTLTAREVEVLALAAARVQPVTPTAKRALRKMLHATPLADVAERESILYSPLVDEYPAGVYERVANGIRQRRTVLVTYRNVKGSEKTYRFDPYALIARDPHLYVVGANHNSRAAGHDPIHEIRLDQVARLRLLRDRFPKPTFDVRAYCRGRFRWFPGEGKPVRIRVRFSREKAGYIRRMRHHATQTVFDERDGSVIWQVEVPFADDLIHWIVGYGPHATVMEPAWLRRRVAEWAKGCFDANMSPGDATTREYATLRR